MEDFQLATSWKSSDGRRIVEGLDGEEEQAQGYFKLWRVTMEDDETWAIRLRVSGANADSQEIQILAHPEAESQLRMSQ